MSTTGAKLVSLIRTETLHDSDTQYTDVQLYEYLGLQHQELRRWLFDVAPELCRVRSADLTVASGASSIAKSAITPAAGFQLERVWLIERKVADIWIPLTMLDSLNANFDTRYTTSFPETVAWQEFPDVFELTPTTSAPGTYRVTYLAGVTDAMAADTAIALPEGLGMVLVARGAAMVSQRHEDPTAYHQAEEQKILRAFVRSIRNRNGSHPKPGLSRKFGAF